jgi:ABC-type polysaccharide/polyol phosphate transport system ATPase subunit
MNAIEVEKMSKIFRVLHREVTMKSEVMNLLRFRLPRREEFVALRDISFTVPKGQTVVSSGATGAARARCWP